MENLKSFEDLLEQGRSKVSEAIKILNGYITYLQKSSKKL